MEFCIKIIASGLNVSGLELRNENGKEKKNGGGGIGGFGGGKKRWEGGEWIGEGMGKNREMRETVSVF